MKGFETHGRPILAIVNLSEWSVRCADKLRITNHLNWLNSSFKLDTLAKETSSMAEFLVSFLDRLGRFWEDHFGNWGLLACWGNVSTMLHSLDDELREISDTFWVWRWINWGGSVGQKYLNPDQSSKWRIFSADYQPGDEEFAFLF